MTLLPIVDRELRIASRRRLVFWGRVAAACFALLVFGCLQLLSEVSRGMFQAGHYEFALLKWMCFIFAGSAGLFLTSDSLSEEKREGTLGLLFLTDLRGYDVVFGKLISHSLQAFYGLLAVFPILGLPILVGGVTGGEFYRVILFICNTLFLSLSMGLLISSVSRDVMKALNGTLLFGLLLFGIFPFADWCMAGWDGTKFHPLLSLCSPIYGFLEAGPVSVSEYWRCLGVQQILAWTFLILASFFAPRAWQDKSNSSKSSRVSFSQRWRYGSENGRVRLRRRMFEGDPLLWLASRDRWLPRLVWCIVAVTVGVLTLGTLRLWGTPMARMMVQFESLLEFGLLLWVASQACRFFIDANRTGALELILVTPVGPERVVRNQWSALWRTFLFPAVMLLAFQIFAEVAMIYQIKQQMSGAKYAGSLDYLTLQTVTMVVGALKFIGNLAAVAWFGMWMGITSRKTLFAILKTLVFVIVLPAMAIWFIQILAMIGFSFGMAMTGGMSMIWLSAAFGGGLSVVKNVFFILFARKRLMTQFRDAMLREARIPAVIAPPPLPPLVPPPPIISASPGAG